VYIGALIFAVVRIYTGITERRTTAEREFFDLADLSSAAGVLGFMNEQFQETIRDAVAASQTLQGVIISGPNGEYAFERDRGTAVAWTGDTPRFMPRFGISKEPFFEPVRIEGQRNVSISAVFNYIDYDLFSMILKRTLLAILIALSLAFFTLILQFLLSKKDTVPVESPVEPSKESEDFPPDIRNEDLFQVIDEIEADAEVNTGGYEKQIDELNFEDFTLPNLDIDDITAEDVPPPVLPDISEAESRGLYAPRSNIGWEAYTKDRLGSELHQCASFDQDMVYIMMEFKDTVLLDDALYKRLADEAVTFFTHRDLIFEKGEWGISVIVPNIDLDQGFTLSEEFHNRILSACSTSDPAKIPELCIGLSSRAGRLVDTERLMLEASQALSRAWDDKVSPIVAFKSDPEKYRAFIATQNKPHL
jgi:hypothetical protein